MVKPFMVFLLVQAHLLNLVCVVGLVLSFIVLLIFAQKSLRTRAVTVFHTTLTICDILLVATAWPVLALNPIMYQARFKVDGHWRVVLPICYSMMNCWQNACILITLVATHERYLAVCYPLYHRLQNCAKRAKLRLVIVITFSILYNIPKIWIMIQSSPGELWNVTGNSTLDVKRNAKSLVSDLRLNLTYIIIYRLLGGVVVASVIPICLLIMMGGRMVTTVRGAGVLSEIDKKASNLSARLSRGAAEDGYNRIENTQITPEKQRQRVQICRMITVHVIKFIVAYTLPTVCDAMEVAKMLEVSEMTSTRLRIGLITVGNFLVILNSSTNFVLYFVFCEDFRNTCRTMFRRLTHCQPHGAAQAETVQVVVELTHQNPRHGGLRLMP